MFCHMAGPMFAGRFGPGHRGGGSEMSGHHHHHQGPGFGARRPLRFMARRLDLNEAQVRSLARILDNLKTERAQARVDQQRSVGLFADALEGPAFNSAKAQEGAALRVKSAERLRDAVITALEETHAMLDDEQRVELATLLRSGGLTI